MQAPEIYRLGHAQHGMNGDETYRFDDIWSLHLYSYAIKLTVDKQVFQIQPGDMTLIAPGHKMCFHYEHAGSQHYYCLFKSEEQFSQAHIHYQLDEDALNCCRRLFHSAIKHQHYEQRSQVAIWEILWQLQLLDEQSQTDPVSKAQHIIASQLNCDLSVAHIARDVGISGNQLTRLFKHKHNMTVIAYIRQERMKLAKRLIQETDLPIKRIAEECGYYDLQYFNKTVRQFFEKSPRDLRNE